MNSKTTASADSLAFDQASVIAQDADAGAQLGQGSTSSQISDASLSELREIAGLTQVEMAERLGIRQSNISKLESRGDMMISTLTSYLSQFGAEMEINVKLGGKRFVLKIEETRGKRSRGKTVDRV